MNKNQQTTSSSQFAVLIFLLLQFSAFHLKAQYDFDADPRIAFQFTHPVTQITKPYLDLVTDFGANPDDNLDDTWAFIKASKYIANQWNFNETPIAHPDINIDYSVYKVELRIPKGANPGSKYIVGLQQIIYNGTNLSAYYQELVPEINIPYSAIYTTQNSSTVPSNTTLLYKLECPYFKEFTKYTTPYTVSTEIFKIVNNPLSVSGTPDYNRNPNGLLIQGYPKGLKPLIEYSPNALFGHTDGQGNPIACCNPINSNIINNSTNSAWPLSFNNQKNLFDIRSATYIKIENLEIKGNNETMIFESIGADGYQQGAAGVYLWCRNISLENLHIHHMSQDGLAINSWTDYSVDLNADLKDITSELNYRHGFHWASGRVLNAEDCKFNYNGTVVNSSSPFPNNIAGDRSAGIDIEFEGSNTVTDYPIQQGNFKTCEFNFNQVTGIHNETPAPFPMKTKNITFDDCVIHKIKSSNPTSNDFYGIFIRGEEFKFINHCKIWCPVKALYIESATSSGTQFIDCDFEDKPFGTNHWQGTGGWLIELQEATKPLFERCTFKVNDNYRQIFYYMGTPDLNKRAIFRDCNFLFNNQSAGAAYDPANGQLLPTTKNSINNANFQGNNSIQSIGLAACTFNLFTLKNCSFEGSTDACNPWVTEIDGNIIFQLGTDIEVGKNDAQSLRYARLKLRNKGIIQGSYTPKILKIGTTSSVEVEEGGSVLASNIDLEGNLIFHPGSYLHQNENNNNGGSGHVIKGIGNDANLFVSTPLNLNGYTVHPFYSTQCEYVQNVIGNPPLYPWMANNGIQNLCVYGSNSNIANAAGVSSCIPNYSYISTSGSFIVMYNVTNALCHGGNGQLDVSIIGGVAGTFEYSINNGATFLTMANPIQFPEGNYNIIIKDANGATCGNSFSFDIEQPDALSFSSTSTTNINCYNGNNGAINTIAIGGVGTITYTLLPTNVSNTTGEFSNLIGGLYTVVASDANNCSVSQTFTIVNPSIIAFNTTSTTNINCYNGNNGAINTNAVGGVGAITYTLLPTNVTNTTGEFSNLIGGLYTVVASDANNCSVSQTFTIVNPSIISFNTTSTTNINCYNGNNGIIDVAASGGTGALNYTILPNNVTNTTGYFSNLVVSVYTVVVSDANNCSVSSSINIIQPNPLAFNVWEITNKLCDATLGEINLQAGGGIAPYTYSVSPNAGVIQTNNTFTNLAVGTYTVSVTDANGCVKTSVAIINEPQGNHCCSPAAEAIVATPNVILLSNTTASDIRTNYNSGSNIVIGKTFYIDGTLTIDENITFDGCTMWLAPSASVVLSSGIVSFNVINNSVMQASCDWWNGILANGFGNKVKIENSMVNNMNNGISIENNAIIDANNSQFNKNATSISFIDITTPNYIGSIYHCTFEFDPVITEGYGIFIANCKEINIGVLNDINSENKFKHLWNGIVVIQGILGTNSDINLFNNSFENISYTDPNWTNVEKEKIDHTYSEQRGAAIYIGNYNSTSPNSMQVSIENNALGTSGIKTSNCDKAIITRMASVDVKNINIENAYVGIANEITTYNKYNIIANTMNHVFNGIKLYGDQNQSIIASNTVTADLFPSIQTQFGMGASFYWPKGIEVWNFATGANSEMDITNNTITIDAYAGLGITTAYTGNQTRVEGNPINLTNNNAGQIVCGGATNLAGIAAYRNVGSTINNNNIIGNTAGSGALFDVSGRVDAAGIMMDNCDEQKVACNSLTNNRFGLLGINENNNSQTADLNIKGNVVAGADLGWVCRHLVNEGSFGKVGNLANDNNNNFISNGIKVFKYCENLQPNISIFTKPSLIIQQESQSINMNSGVLNDCYYIIQNNSGASTFPMSECSNLMMPPVDVIIRIDEALSIANNTKTYLEFDHLGRWFDMKRLFAYLKNNPTVRDVYPVLKAFYTEHLDDEIGYERTADEVLVDLIQSFPSLTEAQQELRMQAAENANNGINGSETQDENERMVNGLYLKILETGYDELSTEEAEWIQNTATLCPFVEGNAVYKARTLNAHYKPAEMYDDLKICNAVGVYKQSNNDNIRNNVASKITLENNVLANIKPSLENVRMSEDEFVIYPNPSHEYLTILHDASKPSILDIYDIAGRIVKTINLERDKRSVTINISELANGTYNYVLKTEDKGNKVGKLTKID
jgi:hypothetical protein